MTDFSRDQVLAGIYRNLEAADPAESLRLLRQIAELLVRIGGGLERAGIIPRPAAPVQAALDLPAPGAIAATIAARPREWGNTVRVYDALWRSHEGRPFGLGDMIRTDAEAIARATSGRVGVATFQRVLSALTRAGAARRERGAYVLAAPTDNLREAVEAARKTKNTNPTTTP